MAGTLIVRNVEFGKDITFKPGGFIVESLGSWHKGASIGTETVKLLVIGQVEKGVPTVIVKD